MYVQFVEGPMEKPLNCTFPSPDEPGRILTSSYQLRPCINAAHRHENYFLSHKSIYSVARVP